MATQSVSDATTTEGSLLAEPFRVTYNGQMIVNHAEHIMPEPENEILTRYPELAIDFHFKRQKAKNGGRDYFIVEPDFISESTPKVKKVAFKVHYHFPVQHPEYGGLLRLQQNCIPADISKAQEEARHILRVYNALNQMICEKLTATNQEDFFCLKPLTQIWEINIQKPSDFGDKDPFSLEKYMTLTGDMLIEIAYGFLRPPLESSNGQGSLVGVNFGLAAKKDLGPTLASENRKKNQKRGRDNELPEYMKMFIQKHDEGKNLHVNMLDTLRSHLPVVKSMLTRMEAEVMRRANLQSESKRIQLEQETA